MANEIDTEQPIEQAGPQEKKRDDSSDAFRSQYFDEMDRNKGPQEKFENTYDPFFQNKNLMQSRMPEFEVKPGTHELLGGDTYTNYKGHESYQNNRGEVQTNGRGEFQVRGDVISLTSNKDETKHTIIFSDGSRVYLEDGRIRSVSGPRNPHTQRFSVYRDLVRR